MTLAPDARAIGVGLDSCAAPRAGPLVCWGALDRFPHWPTRAPNHIATYLWVEPTRIPDMFAERVVISDEGHGCLVGPTGDVGCWGYHRLGALGPRAGPIAAVTYRAPVEIPLPWPAAELATLGGRTCARGVTGQVACWGELEPNPLYQAAALPRVGSAVTLVTHPDGAPLEGVARIDVDLAIDAQGNLFAWGRDLFGEVSRAPVGERLGWAAHAHRVEGLPPIVDAARALASVCVTAKGGEVSCWGWISGNEHREDLSLAVEHATTTPVPIVRNASEIACCANACSALLRDGAVWTWGFGFDPVPEAWRAGTGLADALVMAARGTCARDPAGEVVCWRDTIFAHLNEPVHVVAMP